MAGKKNNRFESSIPDPESRMKTCRISTYLDSPIDGHAFINHDIQKAIDDAAGIEKYVWILHDKDCYTKQNVKDAKAKLERLPENDPQRAYYSSIEEGKPKPANVHILLWLKNSTECKNIARWFNTDVCNFRRNNEDKAKTLNTPNKLIEHYVPYFLHHTGHEEGKHVYDESELHYSPSLKDAVQQALHPSELSKAGKKGMLDAVLNQMKNEKKTLAEVRKDLPYDFYLRNKKILSDAEADVRLFDVQMPEFLLNIYITGPSGSGKTSLAKWVARALYPDVDNQYFNAGSGKVTFQNYMGEKAIIWGDTTPDKLKEAAPGADLLEMLDPFGREKVARNIKYGSVVLMNAVNIFTSTLEYDDFIPNLISDKTDRKQAYRRIPMVINIGVDFVEIMVNSGWLTNKSGNFKTFETVAKIENCSLKRLFEHYSGEYLKLNLEPVLGCILAAKDMIMQRVNLTKLSTEYGAVSELSKITVSGSERFCRSSKYTEITEFLKGNSERLKEIEKEIEEEEARMASIIGDYETGVKDHGNFI